MDPDTTTDALAAPDQAAVSQAVQGYSDAAAKFDYLQRAYDQAAADPKADATQVTTLSNQLDSARTELGRASRDYSTILSQISRSREASARAAKDPNEQRMWANEADKASSQAALYDAEAGLYSSKTAAEMQSWQDRAQAALSRAQTAASRVESQNDRDAASSMLAKAKAAQIPALTQSTIALHSSQMQLAAARTSQSIANANKAQAQTDILIPAEAQKYVAQGLLTQAQANQLQQIGPVKVDALEAKLGLDKTRADAIRAQIGKQQVLPYGDKSLPTLSVFQPSTGQVSGTPNPSYVNQFLQPLKDRADAIEAIKADLAAGKYGQGQQAIDYANQLMSGISQAAQYAAQGYTPQQYHAQQLQDAQFGQGVLNNYMGVLNQGNSMANNMLTAASRARGLQGMTFSPFSTFGAIADQLYGPSIQNAQALLNQVRPVTDRNSALQAFQQLSQVKQHLTDAMQQSGQTMGGAGTADQATNSGINQVDAATMAAGGGSPLSPSNASTPGDADQPDNALSPTARALFAGAFG